MVLQLSAEDYLKMPELVYRNIYVDLPAEAARVYRDVEDDFIALMEKETIVAANAAVAGVKCRQIANGAIYRDDRTFNVLHDEKLDALESLLEELSGKPALIFYEFDHDRERILRRFPDIPVLGSGISESRLADLVDRFNAGKIPALLGHPASMGHGLNLQGSCHHAIWFGITWNLEHYDQAIARIYRQGQANSHVFIYHIIAKDTLDEKVVVTLEVKDRDQQNLLRGLASHRSANLPGI